MDDTGEKVIDLIFGRWRSQILYTGVKLGVFDASNSNFGSQDVSSLGLRLRASWDSSLSP